MIASKNTEELQRIINQQKKEIESLKCKLSSADVTRPNNIIRLDQAQELFANYDERAKMISENFKPKNSKCFYPTRSIFVELNNLKLYLSYIEDKAAAAGITPTGIRFYLSVYDEEINDKDPNRTTFFIAPTTNQGKEMNIGFTFDSDGKTPIYLDAKEGFDDKSFENNTCERNSQQHRILALESGNGISELASIEHATTANVFGGSPAHALE